MGFFVKKRKAAGGGGKPSGGFGEKKQTGVKRNAKSKKAKKYEDEGTDTDDEVDTDDLCSIMGENTEENGGVEDDEEEADDFFETQEENRLKLAKAYLKKLGMEEKEGANEEEMEQNELSDSDDDDGIYKNKKLLDKKIRLQTEVANKQHTYDIADKLSVGAGTFYKGHLLPPTCLCISPKNENIVYTGGKDCAIIQWDISCGKKTIFPGGRKRFNCGGHFEQVMDICVSETANLICSVGHDRLLRLWDHRLAGSPCVAQLKGHTDAITCISADPSDDMCKVYTGSKDKSIKVWSLSARSYMDSQYGHTSGVLCMDILNTGKPITGGEDETVRLWKISHDTHSLFRYHTGPVDACVYLNSSIFASGCQNGTLCIWSASRKKPLSINTIAHGGKWICSLASIRNSDVIMSGSSNGHIKFFKTKGTDGMEATSKLNELLSVKADGFINAMAVSPSSRFLVAAVGKEHKHGRWENLGSAVKNGIYVFSLEHPYTHS